MFPERGHPSRCLLPRTYQCCCRCNGSLIMPKPSWSGLTDSCSNWEFHDHSAEIDELVCTSPPKNASTQAHSSHPSRRPSHTSIHCPVMSTTENTQLQRRLTRTSLIRSKPRSRCFAIKLKSSASPATSLRPTTLINFQGSETRWSLC